MRRRFAVIVGIGLGMATWLGAPTVDCRGQFAVLSAGPDQRDASQEESVKEDGWIEIRNERDSEPVRVMELVVRPRSEPKPALRYRLIPDDFDRLNENSAIYYLKAMGFLEQDPARSRLRERDREAAALAREQGKDFNQVPPAVWRSTPPAELPIEEVKEYLQLTSFQPHWLEQAAMRRQFSLERNLQRIHDPIAYLLPDIQSLRELARAQDLRCRLAIAEGRIDDAIATLGQQYAMANHLEQDEFLVSNLVGIACAGMAWKQALHLIQHPDAPNLYWAYAMLPRPLVNTRYAMSVERHLLFEQLKVLREVDDTPRTAGYWSDFIDRLIPQLGYLTYEVGLRTSNEDTQRTRAMIVAFIAAAYPGAKNYLIEEWGMDSERVKAYPTAQVVFLATVRFYEQWRDEYFKWNCLPYWQSRGNASAIEIDRAMTEAAQRAGFCAAPTTWLLPAVSAVRTAEARCDQEVALLQTVEAIRMHGALHNGQLPNSLDELPVPVPVDPFTGKPLEFQREKDHVILTGHRLPGLQYRLIVRFAAAQE